MTMSTPRTSNSTDLDKLVRDVMLDIHYGRHVVVYTYRPSDREAVTAAFASMEVDGARAVKELWSADNMISPRDRLKKVDAFNQARLGGLFVATLDSMMIAVQFKNVDTVHFFRCDDAPANVREQGIDRARENR